MTRAKPRPKVALAKQLRKAMTEPEVLLWHCLKGRADGLVFKRQKAYGPYILDFYCFAARLVVEVDGASHYEDHVLAKDQAKDAYLACNGLHVHRIQAADVYANVDETVDGIWILALELAAKRKQESPPPRA